MNKNTVIITGINGGIGEALVFCFNQKGYQVIGTDLQKECNDKNKGSCAFYIQADLEQTVIDSDYADNVFRQIKTFIQQENCQLKGLVNNAAVQILGKSDDLTRKDWQQTLDVNLQAPFFWTQAFLPELELAKGSVVNMSSIHARLTKKNFVAYATSKAALSGMTRAMAVDLGDRVRINAIEPAAIETDMLKAGFKNNDTGFAQLKQFHPTQCIGQPSEVAKLAVVLVKGGMQFMNGALVTLDGGIGARLYDPD